MWTTADVEEFLFEWCPRKLSAPDTYCAKIPGSVAAFVEFLAHTGLLAPGGGRPADIRRYCERNTERFLREMRNPASFGMAKSLFAGTPGLDGEAAVDRIDTLPEQLQGIDPAPPRGWRGRVSAQLTRLLEVSELPNVALKVTPFDVGMHAGIMSGPFEVLECPVTGNGRASEPPTVYVDGFTGCLFLDKPSEIDRYHAAFTDIWTAASDEAASRCLIASAAEEFNRCTTN